MVGAVLTSDAAASAVKVSPPVFVSATMKFGVIDWSHAALALTVIYTSLQIGFLLYDRLFKKKD